MCNNTNPHGMIKVLSNDAFINLHVHTSLSILDGMSRIDELVSRVKSLNQSAVAVTEHGNLFSAVKMYKECKKQSVKYIHGVELYVSPKSRFDKDKDNKYYHLTVLAKNEKGRLNMNKLVTKGYLEGFYSKPRVDFELLKEHHEGLIVLSGCMAGELQQTLAGGKIGDRKVLDINRAYITEAKAVVHKFRKVFKDDYYLEVQSHGDNRQRQLNRAIVDTAKEMGIDYVVTSDSHFTENEDKELHDIFIRIGTNREAGETYNDCYIQSESDVMRILQPTLTEEEATLAVRQTRLIADKCNVHIPLSAPLIPHVEIPKEYDTEQDYIKALCNKGWKTRGIHLKPKELQKVYKDRLLFEYDAINEMGFIGYYLLVHSYANSVERRGIARGSGGGSLIAYLINIVDIDPIRYGLYFERFIDVGQLELLKEGILEPHELKIPDFDLDFGKFEREKVVQNIEDEHGKEHFASIGQFGYIWDKSAIKDVGRVLGIDFNILNNITKDLNDLTIKDAREEGYTYKWEKKYPQLFEYAEKLAGLPRSFGVHPCGKIISIDNLLEYHAVAEKEGHLVFQMDMHDAEDLGLVKIDALGLRTVDIIYDVLAMIGKTYREYLDPAKLNFDDQRVYEEVFQKGFTDGVFQFESDGMKRTLEKMKPTNIEDLSAVNALYRPGAMKYIDNYINRKHGEEDFEYLHPDLEDVLKDTYGIIVYQEQLIAIGRLAGMKNADKLRKATGKKIAKLLLECREELVEGLINNRGWTEEQFEQLWDDMLDFAKYSFNKSHSMAYAIIAYMCGFLKVYHPKEFITALFNSFEGKPTRFEGCYLEACRLGVKVNPIRFDNPTAYCQLVDGEVSYGLKLVKHLNAQVAESFKELKDNRYLFFTDLLIDVAEKTAVDSRQMKILIELDFFKKFGNKKLLFELYDSFKDGKGIKYDKKYKDATKTKRIDALIKNEMFVRETLDKKYNEEHDKIYPVMELEKEYYGFIRSTYEEADPNAFAIIDINTKYTPRMKLYNLNSGNIITLKVKKKKFYNSLGYEQLFVGDIIKITGTSEEGKWKMNENDEWVQDDSVQEAYLATCKLLERNHIE